MSPSRSDLSKDRAEAKEACAKHFAPGIKIGPIKEMPLSRLRVWLDEGDLKKPLNRLVRA